MSDPLSIQKGLAKIVARQAPSQALAGTHTYRVDVVTDEGRCDLTAVEDDMPSPLQRVDQWPGIGGAVVIPKVGTQALVVFRDNRKDRPVIVAFQPLRQTGGKPDETRVDGDLVKIAGTSGLAVARVGDTVNCGYFTIGIGPAYALVPSDVLDLTAVQITGTITTGSPKVTSE
jgi:hypothetical protein